MAKTSAGKRTAAKAAPARRKRRWQFEKKTGGIAPASSARAKLLGGAPVSAEAKDQAGAGAFLWIEHFHGSGDAPSTTTITSGSGKRLRNAVVNLIFWGDAWQASPGPSPSLAQVVSDAASILAGPYQVRVAQYGATAARLGTVFVSVPGFNPPKPSFQTSDVAKLITDAIEGGALPEPDEETTDVLHVVFMPPGTAPPPNLGGLHTFASYTDFDFPFDLDINQRSHFAWVFFSSRANISSVFSHELVEALTDPEGDGVQVDPTNPTNWNEIGDVCSSRGTVNGVTVQSYWSQQDHACVIPVNLVFEFEITSIRRSRAGALMYPIDEVAGINHTEQQPFRMTQAEVIAAVDRGDRVFIKGKNGREVDVKVHIHFPPWSLQGVRYITTSPKNARADQLLGLPEE
jgi:hypothetical protein